MRNLQEQRSDETISVRKKLAALNNKQGMRVRIAGSSNKSIDSEIKYLEDLRKTLPPLRHETVETVKALSGKTLTGITAGMSGICNDSPYDDVALWAGGNFEGAIYTMMNPYNLEPKVGQRQANFVVTHRGVIIANQAIIRGEIYATDGIFNGTVYAQDGVFKGTVFASAGEFNGKITSNDEGNRIVIDPEDRSAQLVSEKGNVLGRWYFYGGEDWETSRLDLKSIDNNGNTTAETRLIPAYLEMETTNGSKLEMESERINIVGNSNQFRVSVDKTQPTLQLALVNLPTSKKGLHSGDVWRDGEFLKIVP